MSGIPISFRIFQFVVIHTVQGFGIVNKAEVVVFLELSHFFNDPRCWQFDLWFLCLFLIQLENLEVPDLHIVEPLLENFEHYFASV